MNDLLYKLKDILICSGAYQRLTLRMDSWIGNPWLDIQAPSFAFRSFLNFFSSHVSHVNWQLFNSSKNDLNMRGLRSSIQLPWWNINPVALPNMEQMKLRTLVSKNTRWNNIIYNNGERTRKVPRVKLVQVYLGNHRNCKHLRLRLPTQIMKHELFVCRMEPESWRQLQLASQSSRRRHYHHLLLFRPCQFLSTCRVKNLREPTLEQLTARTTSNSLFIHAGLRAKVFLLLEQII